MDVPLEVTVTIVYTQAAIIENGSIGELLVNHVNDALYVNRLSETKRCPRSRREGCQITTRTLKLDKEYVLQSEFPTDWVRASSIVITAAWHLDEAWANEASDVSDSDILVIITADSETQGETKFNGWAYGGVIWLNGWKSVNTELFPHEFAHIAGAKHTDEPDRLMNPIVTTDKMTYQTMRSIIEYFRDHGIVTPNP